MAKEKTVKKRMPKPEEILELEKIYNTKLLQDITKNSIDLLHNNSYSLNLDGKIIGISLSNLSISDISPLNNLPYLKTLNLMVNEIEDLTLLIPQENLEILYIGSNKVKNIEHLSKFPNLEILVLWKNPIKDFSPLHKLLKLSRLFCENTGLIDISFILQIKSLKHFSAQRNNISDLQCLNKLTNKLNIDVCSNNIKSIPKEVAEKFEWRLSNNSRPFAEFPCDIRLAKNKMEFPPSSVLDLGPESLQKYYAASEEFGHEPLSEGRIIVIGDGSAGKSSLIERVLTNTFEQGKCQTNGIKIEHWHLKNANKNLVFHIWDFGGQEIQHAVHKFFFTEGCLYILVLDNRKEEEPEYWLQQIESLGGGAPVMVMFNKQDDNSNEIADKKFLKEKYPNIVGFFNISCKSGFGINEFKVQLEKEVLQLSTVNEQFPNNWFNIKKAIEKCTSGKQHYLDYKSYGAICKKFHVEDNKTQKLLLKYFSTIGAITWFGDTYLNILHVLSPAWITEGVYKIINSKKTANCFGEIHISDFKELLHPSKETNYIYDENHFGYILSMMKKFDLCYSADDKTLLIPSAFGKVPNLEYSEFISDEVRTYILEFKDYMPMALIHRFIAKTLPNVFENNFWYSGIVIKDTRSDSLAMVQADKIAKRIYVRVKGNSQLGVWEHIRREFDSIASTYASIEYSEKVSLDERAESTVDYEDLISHIKANKHIFFHARLQKDFNVGYLMGLFETKDQTIEKFKSGELVFFENKLRIEREVIPIAINILNNNSPQLNLNTQINTEVNIDIKVINNISSEIKGEANYLLESLDETNKVLSEVLKNIIQFADESKSAKNNNDVKEKGWGRKLKDLLTTLSTASDQFKKIKDGGETIKSIFDGIKKLAHHFDLTAISEHLKHLPTL